jgi:hypothetical protein
MIRSEAGVPGHPRWAQSFDGITGILRDAVQPYIMGPYSIFDTDMNRPLKQPSPPDSVRELDPAHWDPKEILGDVELVRSIPVRVFLLSFGALFIPVSVAVIFPSLDGQ